MSTTEKTAAVLMVIGVGLVIAPKVPDLIIELGKVSREFMALNPEVISISFGCLFLFLGIAFMCVSLAARSSDEPWFELLPLDSDPEEGNRTP